MKISWGFNEGGGRKEENSTKLIYLLL